MINHRHKDLTIRHAVDKVCKACDLEVYTSTMENQIDRIKELIVYMSTCPSGDADDCRLHARWMQEALDGGYE